MLSRVAGTVFAKVVTREVAKTVVAQAGRIVALAAAAEAMKDAKDHFAKPTTPTLTRR